MSKIKVGVIGCGSIAKHRHIPEHAANENVEIVAFCDIVEERAQEYADQYNAKAYTSFEELLKNEEVDAVSVCTPNSLHAPISIAALNAGKHVLCEKPMATSAEEADAMIAAAEKNGKKLMIAHNQRFVASHAKARSIIESGALGKIYSFRTAFGHGGPENWSADGSNSWFFKKELAFIGAMGDLGVHKTDLLRYLIGEEFTEVAAFVEGSAKENSTVDDNAVCILKSESGMIGTLAASWAYNGGEDNSTVFYAENGIMRLEDDPNFSLIVEYKNGNSERHSLGVIQSNEEGQQTDTHVVEHFIASILDDMTPPVCGNEGKKSLQVILAALKSSETKQIVRV
ncbi:Gfo/Idh/MocA family protein [Domibacillus enclensis]|uniref:Dehydrogenase n=1 Tax=Domibacillus enclensis TaxID=1017273 RepID=A0A1N7CQP5_9BACI|nr:Gfo/Idh/MocA family oxidoreductase [Domibacillus enclensis]OXS73422.1 dehydrogenase [Domibacillus enclensis]SIR65956.1 Predicted dehydrogenase [Domibacillus enclensis]